MYAVMVLYIITIMTDRVILGVGKSKAFYIVTEKTSEVKRYIIDTLGHSVTIFDASGGYSKDTQKVLERKKDNKKDINLEDIFKRRMKKLEKLFDSTI